MKQEKTKNQRKEPPKKKVGGTTYIEHVKKICEEARNRL